MTERGLATETARTLPASVGEGERGTPESDRKSRWRPGDRWLRIISVVVFALAWQLYAAPMNPILLPTPVAVLTAFVDLVSDGALVGALAGSFAELILGFGSAVVVGIGVGILMGRYHRIEVILDPYVSFMNATPLVAFIPLLIIWVGIEFPARVIVVFLLSLWPILINTVAGIKNANRGLVEVGTAFGLSEVQLLRWVSLPSSVPYILAGTRNGIAKGIVGMIIGEMDMALAGLGGLVADFGDSFQTSKLMAVIFCTSIFGVVFVVLLNFTERRRFAWIKETAGTQK
jgi:ABC-type nitrate/sulfonate/bicarbonate transport system permease component